MKYGAIVALGLGLIAPCAASAQMILKNEPPLGGLRSGEVVLVDNGKCPKGQILKVTSGVIVGGRNSVSGSKRERSCVPRP